MSIRPLFQSLGDELDDALSCLAGLEHDEPGIGSPHVGEIECIDTVRGRLDAEEVPAPGRIHDATAEHRIGGGCHRGLAPCVLD